MYVCGWAKTNLHKPYVNAYVFIQSSNVIVIASLMSLLISHIWLGDLSLLEWQLYFIHLLTVG